MESAAALRVALAAIPLEMSWDQFAALTRTAIATFLDLPVASDLPGVDLFALANAVAVMVGGPVVINDPQMQVLAFSNLDEPIDETRRVSILSRRAPEPVLRNLRESGGLQQLWSSPGVVRYPAEGNQRARLGLAVRAGDEILGAVFVAEGRQPLGPAAVTSLEEAGRIAALHLLRRRSYDGVHDRLHAELVRGLLEGRANPDLNISRLGLGAQDGFVVLAVEVLPGQGEDTAEAAEQARRMRVLVGLAIQAIRRRAATASLGRITYALLPGAQVVPAEQLRRVLEDLTRRIADSLGVEVRAAAGSTVLRAAEIPHSRREAEWALELLRGDSTGPTYALFADVRARVFLLELAATPALRPYLSGGTVAVLQDYDREHGSEFTVTLQAYLATLGDVSVTAARLNVHRNTVHYRLQRIRALTDLDLGDPAELLLAQAQLTYARTVERSELVNRIPRTRDSTGGDTSE